MADDGALGWVRTHERYVGRAAFVGGPRDGEHAHLAASGAVTPEGVPFRPVPPGRGMCYGLARHDRHGVALVWMPSPGA